MNYHICRLVLNSLCVGDFCCGWYLVVFVLQAEACKIHQHSRRLLKMDILMSETCRAHNKWNKIASDIKLVFHSSTIAMMHGPINIRYESMFENDTIIFPYHEDLQQKRPPTSIKLCSITTHTSNLPKFFHLHNPTPPPKRKTNCRTDDTPANGIQSCIHDTKRGSLRLLNVTSSKHCIHIRGRHFLLRTFLV